MTCWILPHCVFPHRVVTMATTRSQTNRLMEKKTKCGHGRKGLKGVHKPPGQGRPDTPCPTKKLKYKIPKKKK